MTCNLKPVLSEVEVSKACGEPCRTIENLKWASDFPERAGASGSGDEVTAEKG
jgi:hypothetical protein